MLAGVWDLLMVARGQSPVQRVRYAIWLEMKSARGRLTPEQEWFRDHHSDHYHFAVCRSWHEAARALLEYLGTPRTHPAWSGLEKGGTDGL